MKKWYSLIDKIYSLENLRQAFKRVRSNKGAPGIDQETVEEFESDLEKKLNQIHLELKTNTYEPNPVRRKNIPKENGSFRALGIPTVKDRVVQQAVKQIIEPIFEPEFHPSSYAYRPGRCQQMAIAQAEQAMNKEELNHVVSIDLSKCFDRLDHELIIKGVARKISDSRVLKLIRQFLKAGVMEGVVFHETEEGSPQGGVISPLLCNIYLDEFDQKMESKGIKFTRFADDILLFARSPRQAKRYKEEATKILVKDLKLVVNEEKTHLSSVKEGIAFLGVIIWEKYITIHPKKIEKCKNRIRELTPRNGGGNLDHQIKELNKYLRGWLNYYRIANCKTLIKEIMGWVRRRLRMKKMREWKSWKGLHKALRRQGYRGEFKKISMRKWRNSASPLLSMALPNKWFDKQGLYDMTKQEVGILYRYNKCG